MKVTIAQARNGRDEQEDYARVVSLPAGHLAVLADGMGGHEDGAQAARLAVDTAIASVRASRLPGMVRGLPDLEMWGRISAALMRAMHEAAGAVDRMPRRYRPPGCTLVIALVRPDRVWVASAGDSFAVVHGEVITPLHHLPFATNRLTSCLPGVERVSLVSHVLPRRWPREDARVVLGSDGLVRDGAPWVGEWSDDAATLVRATLARREAGLDNITAIVLTPGEPGKQREWHAEQIEATAAPAPDSAPAVTDAAADSGPADTGGGSNCPRCGSDLAFSWLGTLPGNKTPAKCLRVELAEYGLLPADVDPCDWRGHVVRRRDGGVEVLRG